MELGLLSLGAMFLPALLGFLVAGILGGACLWARRSTTLAGFGWIGAGWIIRGVGAIPSLFTPFLLRSLTPGELGRLMMGVNAIGWLINVASTICLLVGTFRLIEDARRRHGR